MESVIGKRCLSAMEGTSASDVCLLDRPMTEPAACTTSSGQGCGLWLDIMTIALGQESKGKWYVSTLELQLASFDVCVACRGVRTVRVTVGKRMALSLWDDDDSLGDSLKSTQKRRRPALRAAGVEWKMPAGMLVPVLSGSMLLKQVEWMRVTLVDCLCFNTIATASSGRVDLPKPLTRLEQSPKSYFEAMLALLDRNNDGLDHVHRLDPVSWPPELRELSLNCMGNERIDIVTLPSLLERLALGGLFDQPIESVSWPVALTHLTLGNCFDQPIADVVWPASLLELVFGHSFDQPITHVVWPASVVKLAFGDAFDHPIIHIVWPASLLQMTFGGQFDQPITGVVWPASLLQLAFGGSFDQPIAEVVWPASLRQLAFGRCFDQPITDVVWPPSLKDLVFGSGFNHPINHVSWPSALHSLKFGRRFQQPTEEVVWPSSLRWIEFSDTLSEDVTVVWPPSFCR